MKKSDFLVLKDLFERYRACEQALDKLAHARRNLNSQRMVRAGMFSVELGIFRTQIGTSAEVSTEAFRQLVLNMIDQLVAYYQEQLAALDQQIEKR